MSEAVSDAVALQDVPGAVAYDDADSGPGLDLPHPVAAARHALPTGSLMPRRLAFVPKPDIALLPDATPEKPAMANLEPDRQTAVRSTRAMSVRLASLSRTPKTSAFSAFAAAFPADGEIATAADMTSSESGGMGSPDLSTMPETAIVEQTVSPAYGEQAPSQTATDDPALATAPSVAHAGTGGEGHGSPDLPPQSPSSASGSSGELPPVADQPMT